MVKLSHTSGTMHALLLLGSNQGDALCTASISDQAHLSAEMALIEQGSVYQTAAWGFEGPPFLNQVIEVRFKGSAHALLATCLAIEVPAWTCQESCRRRLRKSQYGHRYPSDCQ